MRPMHPHHMHPVQSPYPDNWPWSEPVPPRPPHLCCPPPPPPPWAPHPCPPPPFIPTPGGFCAQEPENGTPVSGLAKAIRHSKRAFLSLTSVPALFSVDVQDGDIVKPVPADDSFKDLLCAMGPATKLPDAVWVPAFRTVDSQPDTQTDGEAPTEPAKPVLSDYTPSFYGVAYRGVSRVMIGPVVTHPRFVFHTGDKVYADANGDLTLTENENFVGVCLAPGSLYLLPQTSAFSEFLEAYRQEIIETATKEIIESIEGGDLDGGSITVTVPGTTADRPLSDRLQDVVNIKDFGAVGDGATDNAMAFFLAMQRAQELGSNVCLFIPVGDYLTTQLPTVPCYGPGSIIFDGQTYAPFELLFAIKGGISKDTNGRYKVNPAEFSEDAIRDLIDKILGAGGDGENPGGGGIGIDEDGNIVIDFGSLTEEQIQELLEILNKYLPDLNKPVVDPNGGLTNTNLGLAIKPATHGGLYTTSLGASILLDADSGLKLSPAGVSVQVASAGGLQVDSAGVAMKVKASGGIVVDAEGAAVRVATPDTPGIMRPDNTTCTVENGVLTALGVNQLYDLGDGELNLYVRPDGSDSNDGLANTPERAWATIDHAVEWINDRRFSGAGWITVRVADGTYTATGKRAPLACNGAQFAESMAAFPDGLVDPTNPQMFGSSRIVIVGNVANPSAVRYVIPSSLPLLTFVVSGCGVYGLTLSIQPGASSQIRAAIVSSSDAAAGYMANCILEAGPDTGVAQSPHTAIHGRGVLTMYGNITIRSISTWNPPYLWWPENGGYYNFGHYNFGHFEGNMAGSGALYVQAPLRCSIESTVSGVMAAYFASPAGAPTNGFVRATGSTISAVNPPTKRYNISFPSTFDSQGTGANFFPGTQSGVATMPSSLYF